MKTELAALFAYPARTGILEALHRHPRELGLRQVGRIAGVQPRSAQLALRDLEQARWVRRRQDGREVRFSLNRAHPSFGLLAAVLDAAEAWKIGSSSEARRQAGRAVVSFVVTAGRMLNRARRSRNAIRQTAAASR
jgi:DNA-binding transcriptional ArsR family regulator